MSRCASQGDLVTPGKTSPGGFLVCLVYFTHEFVGPEPSLSALIWQAFSCCPGTASSLPLWRLGRFSLVLLSSVCGFVAESRTSMMSEGEDNFLDLAYFALTLWATAASWTKNCRRSPRMIISHPSISVQQWSMVTSNLIVVVPKGGAPLFLNCLQVDLVT